MVCEQTIGTRENHLGDERQAGCEDCVSLLVVILHVIVVLRFLLFVAALRFVLVIRGDCGSTCSCAILSRVEFDFVRVDLAERTEEVGRDLTLIFQLHTVTTSASNTVSRRIGEEREPSLLAAICVCS